eukprot:scaffold2755_cov333-Prasinococcus_capsulatus_cf.AAC.2
MFLQLLILFHGHVAAGAAGRIARCLAHGELGTGYVGVVGGGHLLVGNVSRSVLAGGRALYLALADLV